MGELPIVGTPRLGYIQSVNKNFYQDQNQKPAGPARVAAAGELNHNKTDFPPYADEVVTKAYLSYVNEGFQHGRHVEHWLDAEAQLLDEHKITLDRGLPKPSKK